MSNTRKIICLVVDDEPPALEVIKKYIASIHHLELAGTCADAVDALTFLRNQPIDLLFLDIQMPQIMGTDFVRTLKNPPKVIFTTAFRKFAVEGFELDAVDYLLKPISFERFLKAVNKVMNLSLPVQANEEHGSIERIENKEAFLFVRCDRKTLKIPIDEILYIEAVRDYIKIVCAAKSILSKQSITSLEDSLPAKDFLRIHRSYIVSLKKIDAFTQEVIEIGKLQLPISRMYRNEVNKLLQLKQ